ncbi:efflux RND transporter periplasmic adaptor subunit [Thermodesulfovibrio yellowstonii]|uniref:Acriflavine resistance protein A n=1 Tax=Thermodesulfovibrio yellowstonii (strain ATCC 51303 / DSM 11347 / YP87) TaxID=289376 RepID=B5YGG4_THEYD|nr:efflux RND transporter periplasmic adaptor subunit [Thermodesulfovibrio yellowstonii]ACI20674.1 acriflavine resistance protein A [Thermodesulfovibrio yellowstonii DSM 11347]ACI21387.1 acriflavine resistance protein A [Thermodesulfovibrio yellowstonii DSM 11347]
MRIKLMLILFPLLFALFLLGCEKKKPMPQIPEVSVIKIDTEEILLTTELPGRTSPYKIAEIRPQVSGIILKRYFTEGSNVKAGEVLYQIDPAQYKAAYDNAKAALSRAEANLQSVKAKYERYQELIKVNAISKQEFDDVKAQYEQTLSEIEALKAQVRNAQINLGYTKITAPISGRIGKSNVTEGALVTAYQAQELTRIQQLDPIYVDIPQSTKELRELEKRLEQGRLKYAGKEQNKVKLILEDGTDYPLEGTLQFKDVTVDPTTGSVTLRAIFPNPKGILLPGMFVRAVIREGINKKAILVPQQVVFRDTKGNPFVYIVDKENKVQIRPIQVDRTIGDRWLVSEGLEVGEQVVIEGVQRIMPGAQVKPVPYTEQKKEQSR